MTKCVPLTPLLENSQQTGEGTQWCSYKPEMKLPENMRSTASQKPRTMGVYVYVKDVYVCGGGNEPHASTMSVGEKVCLLHREGKEGKKERKKGRRGEGGKEIGYSDTKNAQASMTLAGRAAKAPPSS